MPSDQPKTVAVVGASGDRGKFGNKGLRAFVRAGWRAFPVHPSEGQVEGLDAVRSVDGIDAALDVVSLYVPAAVGVKLLPNIAAKQPGEVWVNPGAESAELIAEARRLGLRVRQTCSIIEVGYRPADFP